MSRQLFTIQPDYYFPPARDEALTPVVPNGKLGDFPTDGLSPGAAAMVEALKEYGMFHADGGNVTFIASNDELSEAKWEDAEVGLGPNELKDAGMQWTDFEVVSNLSMVETMAGNDCSRTPLDEF